MGVLFSLLTFFVSPAHSLEFKDIAEYQIFQEFGKAIRDGGNCYNKYYWDHYYNKYFYETSGISNESYYDQWGPVGEQGVYSNPRNDLIGRRTLSEGKEELEGVSHPHPKYHRPPELLRLLSIETHAYIEDSSTMSGVRWSGDNTLYPFATKDEIRNSVSLPVLPPDMEITRKTDLNPIFAKYITQVYNDHYLNPLLCGSRKYSVDGKEYGAISVDHPVCQIVYGDIFKVDEYAKQLDCSASEDLQKTAEAMATLTLLNDNLGMAICYRNRVFDRIEAGDEARVYYLPNNPDPQELYYLPDFKDITAWTTPHPKAKPEYKTKYHLTDQTSLGREHYSSKRLDVLKQCQAEFESTVHLARASFDKDVDDIKRTQDEKKAKDKAARDANIAAWQKERDAEVRRSLPTAKSLYSASYVNAYRKCMYNYMNSSAYKSITADKSKFDEGDDNWSPDAYEKWREAVTKKKLSCGAKFVAAVEKLTDKQIDADVESDGYCVEKSQHYQSILVHQLDENEAFRNSNPKWASLYDNDDLHISWGGCYKNGSKWVCLKDESDYTEDSYDRSLEKVVQGLCQQKKHFDACVKGEHSIPDSFRDSDSVKAAYSKIPMPTDPNKIADAGRERNKIIAELWLALPLSDRKKKCAEEVEDMGGFY